MYRYANYQSDRNISDLRYSFQESRPTKLHVLFYFTLRFAEYKTRCIVTDIQTMSILKRKIRYHYILNIKFYLS